MRKYLIPLLLATALTPAMAQTGPDRSEVRSEARSERSAQRTERSNADRPARAERNINVDRPARAERAERALDRSAAGDRTNRADGAPRAERPAQVDRVRPVQRDGRPVQQVETPAPVQNAQNNETPRGGFRGAFTQLARDMANSRNDDYHDGDGRDHDGKHHWDKDWRHHDRYDWWGYRNRYRSLFHLGNYYDPYGWGYRRWSAGYSLWPSYYGSNYWLDDPWMYRLPPAYGPYRWVRYYDDALLVNTYTGEVVDVVYNFFW